MICPIAVLAFLATAPTAVVGQKAGLPWAFNLDINQFLTTGKVDWYYTYGTTSITTSPHIEFVPQLWGSQQAASWDSSINNVIKTLGVTHVLGFNEPNEAGQADLDPATAAALWQQHIQPLKAQGVLLGSPAPSARPNGLQWLQQFMQLCSGCTVDFIAMHQDVADTATARNNIESYHNTFPGKPIWVTQLSCQTFNGGTNPCGTVAEVSAFMKTMQSFLDSASYVERYAWNGEFAGDEPNDLMDSSGKINSLGKQYIGE